MGRALRLRAAPSVRMRRAAQEDERMSQDQKITMLWGKKQLNQLHIIALDQTFHEKYYMV